MTQNDESTYASQRSAHRSLLGGKERLIEAIHDVEGFPRAKQEAASRETSRAIKRQHACGQHSSIPRNLAIETNAAASSDRTGTHGGNRGEHDVQVHHRIGVDKHEHVTAGGFRSDIASRSDMATPDGYNMRVVRARDLSRAVSRGVVHDDHFAWVAQLGRRLGDRIQRAPQQLLLVVRGNNE